MVDVCAPSATSSSTAVTVIVWGVLQLPVVNVSTTATPAPAPRLVCVSGSTVSVTLAVGCDVSTSSYVSEVGPDSSTSVAPADSVTVTPAVSLSVIEAVTLATTNPL
jgi:hypothetical protein